MKENVIPSMFVNIWHIGRLLIQFALGEFSGKTGIDYTRNHLIIEPIFKTKLSKDPEDDDEIISSEFDCGTLLIEFIRYLASQAMASSKQLNLRVFDNPTIIEPVLFKRTQWMPLHHVAYRTFHAIAVSGRFDAMHLNIEDEKMFIAESRDPILINEALFFSKSYSDVPISRHRVIAALKNWSGVREIIPRENSGRKSDLVYVTSVGTVLARQRLSRLLLLSGETIRDAIVNERIPVEVRDDFL
ncbi:unnamed protein product [Caenorhabditis angaria]|uniref:DUF7752 domain-containing protein n=1 Tax=Caenorhabditis angaria TaxID=860376 RepID=A0A9P1MWF8_9PELO|nr:unnamed protein product [Caenorhabditis angaria]